MSLRNKNQICNSKNCFDIKFKAKFDKLHGKNK